MKILLFMPNVNYDMHNAQVYHFDLQFKFNFARISYLVFLKPNAIPLLLT